LEALKTKNKNKQEGNDGLESLTRKKPRFSVFEIIFQMKASSPHF
jgi:hypothetical protein